MGKGSRNRQRRETALGSFDRDQMRALDKIIKEKTAEYYDDWLSHYWADVTTVFIWSIWKAIPDITTEKLREIYDSFDDKQEALREKYCIDDETNAFVCGLELKEAGIDLSNWEKPRAEIRAEIRGQSQGRTA